MEEVMEFSEELDTPAVVDSDETSQSAAIVNMDDVDITVMCEVASVKLSLAELSQLKIGDTLELSSWPNTVRLLVGGRPIAEGVLVEISGMLAVKIIRKL